ncbi:MAG: hypothetical protein HY909_16085 [Deltaproteobacteria bacterium]|nr:hypothetical protein [Deltaproteobacteria bacterium]
MKSHDRSEVTRDARCVEMPAAVDPGEDDGEGARRARTERHLAQAAAVAAEEVQVARMDPGVMWANVRFAMANLGVTKEEVQRALPAVPVDEVFELPSLALTLLAVCGSVRRPVSTGEVQRRLERVGPLRARVLSMAEVLVAQGYLDHGEVARIRAGTGRYDMAMDAVQLAMLFREHRAGLEGLHPFRAEDLATLYEDGAWLVDHLTPARTRRVQDPVRDPARDTRDRLWTLLLARYDWLRRVAYYFHGEAFEARVPRLQSMVPGPAARRDKTEEAKGGGPPAGP